MNLFIYLIVWWAIFNENQTKLTENLNAPSNASNNNKNEPIKMTEITKKTSRNETENKSTTSTTKEFVDHHKTTKRSTDEKNEHQVSKPKADFEKTEKPTTMPPTTPMVTSQPNSQSTPLASDNQRQTPKDETIHLPIYAMVMIMFAMAIMFFIIMALLIMLYKINQNKRSRDSMNVAIQPTNDMNYKYVRQLSGETSNASTLFKDNKNESKFALKRNDNQALFFNNLDTIDATKEKPSIDVGKTSTLTSLPKPESKPSAQGRPLRRIVKQSNTNHVPITREQMFELCKGVLSKTKKSIEATSLSELEKISKESRYEEKDKANFEKCLSTPELDSQTYDVLPTPSKGKFFNSDDDKNEVFDDDIYDKPPKNKTIRNDSLKKNKNEETDDGVYDNPLPNKHDFEVFDEGIYDNPPPKHNRKINIIV